MNPWSVLHGCALDVLPTLPEACVQMVCTSPPYWALRKYKGVNPTRWPAVTYCPMPGLPPVTIPEEESCLGLERDPMAFVGHLLLIFRAVRRVLRRDATCWVNLGDSYSAVGKNPEKRRKDTSGVERPRETKKCERCGEEFTGGISRRFCSSFCGGSDNSPVLSRNGGIPPKSLLNIPHRFALAMQGDGWVHRNTIRWFKVSPMPSSVRDRCTNATEEIFVFAQGQRYFWDQEAGREKQVDFERGANGQRVTLKDERPEPGVRNRTLNEIDRGGNQRAYNPAGRNPWDWWAVPDDAPDDPFMDGEPDSAWLLASEPSRLKHYASFPSEIPRRAIRMGSSVHGQCSACGAPYRRVVEKGEPVYTGGSHRKHAEARPGQGKNGAMETGIHYTRSTLGFSPSCTCNTPIVPQLVLDPFAGTCQTGVVARELGRRFVGIDASLEYVTWGRQRLAQATPLADAIEVAARHEQRSLFEEAP